MLGLIARFVTRHPWPVIALFVVVTALCGLFGFDVQNQLAATGLNDPGSDSVRAGEALMDELGIAEPNLMVIFGDDQKPAPTEDLAGTLGPTIEALRADPSVLRVSSPLDRDRGDLRSEDGQRVLTLIELRGGPKAQQDALKRLEPIVRAAPLPTLLGGPLAAEREAQQLAITDLQNAELFALPVVAILLLMFFRGPWAAALPLAIGLVSLPATMAVLRLLAQVTEVSVFALNVATFIGTGLSIDYAMVLVQRFRDERAHGRDADDAISHTLQTSGWAIVISGVTVAASLLALLVFPLGILRTIALSGSLTVVAAMGAALVLLPALLKVLAPRLGQSPPPGPDGGAWHKLAVFVMRWPVLITAAVLLVLGLLAAPTLRLKTVMPDVSTFPKETEVRRLDELLDSPTGFGATNQTPILALVRTDGPVIQPENAAAVAAWAAKIKALPGVRRVDSPFASGPLSNPVEAKTFLKSPHLMPGQLRHAVQLTTKGDATLVAIVGHARWRSDEAGQLVRDVRAISGDGVTVLVGGPTAVVLDAREALSNGLGTALTLVVVVNLILLFLAFGSVVVPIKAVLMNVASIGASFGALVWIFQDGHLVNLLHFEPPGGIDLTVPVIMFAVVFGLSMDYEVFLLARIKEEFDRTGDNTASVALGLERTGSIITRAAALLVVVVVGFAAGRFLFIQELGAGMVVALTIDVTIVRALLVPATMAMLGDANWWAPRRLRRVWKKLDLEIRED